MVITSYATLAREVAEKLSAAMMKKESEVPADELDDDVTAHTPLLRGHTANLLTKKAIE